MKPPLLSPRQEEVLYAVTDGLTDKEAGELLGVSARTVHYHVERLRVAFGVGRKRELVALGRRYFGG